MIRKTIIVLLTLGAFGTGVGWIVSFTSSVSYTRNAKRVTLHGGFLEFKTFSTYPQHQPRQGWHVLSCTTQGYRHPCDCTFAEWLSYQGLRGPQGGKLFSVASGVACWVPFVLLSAYPTLVFIRGPLRRWRRHRRGLCLRCGYNLEGNLSGVCPECGEAT